ncbi:ATP-grasp domain-containing protein [Pelagibacteraceae bacterium]|nr:ATP-grasp domain-containing protein [Pelagibacteraceae bacterium]
MKKKILFLGASHTQVPPIKYAKKMGHYVICCDQKEKSPGFKFCDQSYVVSTTNKKKILEISKKLKINGIVTYVSDAASPTVSYVSKKLKLEGLPIQAVNTLINKNLFRKFLKKNNFNYPKFKTFKSTEKISNFITKIGYPFFIKPIDSSGSKGVTKVKKKENIKKAVLEALSYSRKKKFIIEKVIDRKGYQVAGDGFVMNKKLVFRCWGDEHFNEKLNGLITIGPSIPSIHSEKKLKKAHKETQRVINLLGINNGALNFDLIFDKNDNLFFLEIAPRNGGGLLPELIQKSTNVDLIKYTVDTALGMKLRKLSMEKSKGYWSSFMVHSIKKGTYKNLFISNKIKSRLIKSEIFVKTGDSVKKYGNSQHILGNLILKFKDQKEMLSLYKDPEKHIRVNLL